MNQSDATLAAEALAAECLELQQENARLRGVIEEAFHDIDPFAAKSREAFEALRAVQLKLRAALSPVQ